MIAGLFANIRQYARQSPSRQIGVASAVNAILSVAARTAGLAREVVVAAVFGISGVMDAYLMAFALIGIPFVVMLNAVQSVLIPAMVGAAGDARRQVFRSTVTGTLLLMGIVLCVMLLVLPQLIGSVGWGFSAQRQQQVAALCYALIPYYVVSAVNILGYGALQADRRFLANGMLPAVVPVVTVAVLWLFREQVEIQVLVWGATLGVVAELLLIETLLSRNGLTLLPGAFAGRPECRSMWRDAVVLMPGTAVMAFVPLIDQTLASGLGEGAIASLGYGARLPAAINSILVTAIGISALPYLANMIHEGRLQEFEYTIERISGALLALGLIAAGLLMITSGWIVEIIYERGAFDRHAREAVVPIQQVYSAQLPGMLVGMLATRVHIAQGRGRTLTVVAIFSTLLYAACAWWLSTWAGAVGIAATAAIISSVNAAWLYRSAKRHLTLDEWGRPTRRL